MVLYKGWGETQYVDGTLRATYKYTGQRQDSYINLYWYDSRWYDDALGRFIQPDTIIPEQSQVVCRGWIGTRMLIITL